MSKEPSKEAVEDLLAEKAKREKAATAENPAWAAETTATLSACFDKALTALATQLGVE